LGDIDSGPDDLGSVSAVELLDSLAGIAGELAKRVHRVGQHTRKNLHPVVGRARLVGPLIAPATDYRPDLFRTIELGNSESTEIFCDAIQPRRPIAFRRSRKLLLVVIARPVQRHAPETPSIGPSKILLTVIVGGKDCRRSQLAAEAGAAAPRVVVGATLGRDLCNAPQINLHHGAPRTLIVRGPGPLAPRAALRWLR